VLIEKLNLTGLAHSSELQNLIYAIINVPDLESTHTKITEPKENNEYRLRGDFELHPKC